MADIADQLKLPDYASVARGAQTLIGLQGNLLQQQALRQQLGANQAASEAMRGAIDPETGNFNMAKFAAALQGGPYAYNIPEYAAKAQNLTNAQLANQSSQLDIKRKQLDFFDGQLGSLVSLGPKVTSKDVINVLADGVRLQMLTPEQAAGYAVQIPENNADLQGWVRRHWVGLQSVKDQYANLPQGATINAGAQTLQFNRDPVTGQLTQVGAIRNTLTPAEAATRVPVLRNDQPGTVALGSTVGNGTPLSSNPTFLPTSPALGEQKVVDAVVDRYNSLREAANNAPIAINGYDHALDALAGAKTSGAAADTKLLIPTLLQSFGLQDEGGTVQNFQSLKKYLANAGAQAAAAAGYSGSDARLASFTQGQPDPTHMNPGALRDAIQYVKALQTGVLAKSNAAQDWLQTHGDNKTTLPEFERQWSNAFNPDVMELRNMSREEQVAYIAKLPPNKKKALIQSYQKMSQVGAF